MSDGWVTSYEGRPMWVSRPWNITAVRVVCWVTLVGWALLCLIDLDFRDPFVAVNALVWLAVTDDLRRLHRIIANAAGPSR